MSFLDINPGVGLLDHMVALFLKIYLFLCLYFGAALHKLWDFSSQPWIGPRASLVAEMVKNLPAMWEIWVQSLGQEDPMEKGMATHSGILTWRIPRTEEPAGL